MMTRLHVQGENDHCVQLEQVNLVLSSACGARCIFCPENRGRRILTKIMPFECVEAIVDEIASREFCRLHDVRKMEVGENGDAFLNKDLVRILRLVRRRLPQIEIGIFTNFQNFTGDLAEVLLGEDLIDSVTCNIDGATSRTYHDVKRLKLDRTMANLKAFIRARDGLGSELGLGVRVLSLHRYIHTVRLNLGFDPSRLEDPSLAEVKDDSLAVLRQLKRVLDLSKDDVQRAGIVGWAERGKVDLDRIDYSEYSCPQLPRIEREAFIAPDGTWYACCLDSNNELVLGNVIKDSLLGVSQAARRRQLIASLKDRDFAGVGGPCATVNCCQWLPEDPKKGLHSIGKIMTRLMWRLAARG